MHGLDREVAAGADGVVAVDFAMDGEGVAAAQDLAAQVIYQLAESGELTAGGMAFLEIADEADTNSVQVDLVPADVAALELRLPSRTQLNLAIPGVDAVADDEMVGQSVLHAASPVVAVVDFGVAVLGGAVVPDDVAPALTVDGDPGKEGGDIPSGISRRRNPQGLADADQIGAKLVGMLQIGNADPVAHGQPAEGVSPPDNMNGPRSRDREGHSGGQQYPGKAGYETSAIHNPIPSDYRSDRERVTEKIDFGVAGWPGAGMNPFT